VAGWVHTSLYASLLYHGGYTFPICLPTIPPWVYPAYTLSQVYQMYCTEQRTVGVRGALGSKQEKPLGECPMRVLKPLILLMLLGSDAQSCLLSRARTGRRLDSDRIYPRVYPRVRLCCAEGWFSFPPSDRWENVAQIGVHSPRQLRVNVSNAGSMGPTGLFLSEVANVAQTPRPSARW